MNKLFVSVMAFVAKANSNDFDYHDAPDITHTFFRTGEMET